MLQTIYKYSSVLLSPLIDIYLLVRMLKGKEDKNRFFERLGKTNISRPEGKLVWFHAASIGEAVSAIPMIERTLSQYPSINILITSGTVTSQKVLLSRLPRKVIHQYVPVDKLHVVKRFLAHWRPDLAIFLESEIWPNLITETAKTSCSLVLVNARISKSSYNFWKKYKNFSENIFSSFSLILTQNEIDATRLTSLSSTNAEHIGNLKYDAATLPADAVQTGKMVKLIGARNIWLAASTSHGEDEIIISAHKKLLEKDPSLLLIIVPRHPERGVEIEDIANKYNLKSQLRTQDEKFSPDTQIYIANTVGELGIFYRLSPLCFIGGSLVAHGGQNPLEAARLQCAIISGKNYFNFQEIYSEMSDANAVKIVNENSELYEAIYNLLFDKEKQHKLSVNASNFVEEKKGVVDKYMNRLKIYLNPLVDIDLQK